MKKLIILAFILSGCSAATAPIPPPPQTGVFGIWHGNDTLTPSTILSIQRGSAITVTQIDSWNGNPKTALTVTNLIANPVRGDSVVLVWRTPSYRVPGADSIAWSAILILRGDSISGFIKESDAVYSYGVTFKRWPGN